MNKELTEHAFPAEHAPFSCRGRDSAPPARNPAHADAASGSVPAGQGRRSQAAGARRRRTHRQPTDGWWFRRFPDAAVEGSDRQRHYARMVEIQRPVRRDRRTLPKQERRQPGSQQQGIGKGEQHGAGVDVMAEKLVKEGQPRGPGRGGEVVIADTAVPGPHGRLRGRCIQCRSRSFPGYLRWWSDC